MCTYSIERRRESLEYNIFYAGEMLFALAEGHFNILRFPSFSLSYYLYTLCAPIGADVIGFTHFNVLIACLFFCLRLFRF